VTAFPKLAGLAEVAGLAGVSRKRAWQITQTRAFPDPVQVLAMGPVWRESDVLAFLATPRHAGRQVVNRAGRQTQDEERHYITGKGDQ
jgi:prophage regulatory protein